MLALVILDGEGSDRISMPAFLLRTVSITLVVGAAIAIVLASILDRVDSLSSYPDSHSASQQGQLHPEPGMGPELFRRSVRSVDTGFAIHCRCGVRRWSAFVHCFWASGSHFWWGSGERLPLANCCLGRAFEVLTMERFSYWATLLAFLSWASGRRTG